MTTLRASVQDYLDIRRGLGFKLSGAGPKLIDFVTFLEEKRASHISVELALEWAQKPRSALPGQGVHRLSLIRGFARYRSAIDPQTQIPPTGLLPRRSGRARPYFYTDQEIEQLLAAALALPPARGVQGWKYYCLFGLLIVTGLRISEALNLTLDDVDLNSGVLHIRNTKFGKSRRIPLHPSAQQALSNYLERRNRFLAGRSACYIFVSRTGNRLDKAQVHRTFNALSRQIGLRGHFARRGPRLHDFRHRFARETLLRWYRGGHEIEPRLPLLSTYMGHVRIKDTYWYLNAFPELMGWAVKRLESHREDTP
jgi:integrase